MHPSRLRLGPSQSRPLTDASPGSARSPGLRVYRAAPSRRRNIHTHAPFRTECQSFLRCRDVIADFAEPRSGDWRASMQRMLTDPDLHVTARPSVYEVALELHPGDIPA